MPDEPRETEGFAWLVAPPQPVEPTTIEIHVAVGEDAQLTPEVRESLQELVRALDRAGLELREDEPEEVEGHGVIKPRPSPTGCPTQNCTAKIRCAPEQVVACFTYTSCRIVACPSYR